MVKTGWAVVHLKYLIKFTLILVGLQSIIHTTVLMPANVDVQIHLEFVCVFCLFFVLQFNLTRKMSVVRRGQSLTMI